MEMLKVKKNWFKKINNNFKVFDFENLSKEKFNFFILISSRGQGKTYNMVSFMRKQYLLYGSKSVFCYNTYQQWVVSLPRFIANHLLIEPENWKDIKVTSKGILDLKTKELFIYFVALSGAAKVKGARDGSIKFICLDEFAENLTLTRKHQVVQFESILHTFTNPVSPQNIKVFIFGNQNSINSSLLLPNLGINNLNEELKIIDDFIFLWIVKPTNINFKKLNKNWLYKFSEKVELSTFSFENKPKDNYINIVLDEGIKRSIIKGWKKLDVLKIDDFYFQEYQNEEKSFFEKLKRKPKFDEIFCARNQDIEVGTIYNFDISDYLKELIINKNLFFDSQFTKLIIFALF